MSYLVMLAALCQTSAEMIKDKWQVTDEWRRMWFGRPAPFDALQGKNGLKPSDAPAQFREGAKYYRSLRNGDQETADSDRWLGHFNLGAGDLPRAIASYRRGLALDPADEKLRLALAYARAQVEYPPRPDLALTMQPETEFWPPWLTLRRLGLPAFVLYVAGCLAALRHQITQRSRWWVSGLALLSLAAIPTFGSLLEWQNRRRDAALPVVVAAEKCVLRTGNGTDYPPRLETPLPAGCEARRFFDRGDWWQVELASGVVGWLPRSAIVTLDD